MKKKIVGLLIIIAVFISMFSLIVANGKYIFRSEPYYSETELKKKEQNAYDKGVAENDNFALRQQIIKLNTQLNECISECESYKKEITELTTQNNDYKTQVSNLENQKTTLQEQVETLTAIKVNNEETISQLNAQIIALQNEVSDLKNSNEDKTSVIEQKNAQITSLQSSIAQLQKTNELNVETITALNNQIVSLNSQISDMTLQIQNNSTNVTALNNKIAELEKSVAYYEQYIAGLENGEQIALTFEFDGSVYNIQIVNKNDKVSVVNPTSTDYVVFNYWTVNEERIDLSTYKFTANTKIVANVTYKYDVKFMVDETEYNTQIVTKNGYATIPNNPTKEGYEFDGWTTNRVDIVSDINTTAVTQNTTYVAKFTKLHTVTFVSEGSIISTQKIRNNSYATEASVSGSAYKIFNGWKLNGAIVEISNTKIVSDTTFIADWTYKYDVKFMVDETEYDSQIVTKNGYATLPSNPTKEGYEFEGWTINGVDIVSDINTTPVTQNTTYVAKFTKIHTVTFVSEGSTISTQKIRNNSYATEASVSGSAYKIFNGWKLNGAIVKISNTKIVADTTFVADWTYKYDVKFMVDETEYDSQIVTKNGYATLPSNPTKEGYEFEGWTINGVDIVFPDTISIENEITFHAVFVEIVYFDSDYFTQLEDVFKTKNIIITNEVISSMSFLKNSNKEYLTSLKSGIDVYYSLDKNNYYEFDFVSNKIFAPVDSRKLFYNYNNLTSLDLSNFNTSKVTNMYYMFGLCKNLTSLDVSSFDTGKVNEIGYMFYGCSGLTSLNLSNFNTSGVKNMHSMFYGCSGLTSLNLSNFNTSRVNDMHSMFYGCSGLTSLNLSSFDTGKVNEMSYMFYGCSGLTSLNLSSFNTGKVYKMSCMFCNCSGLTSLNLSNFDTSNVNDASKMFSNCSSLKEIIIGDDYTLKNLPI